MARIKREEVENGTVEFVIALDREVPEVLKDRLARSITTSSRPIFQNHLPTRFDTGFSPNGPIATIAFPVSLSNYALQLALSRAANILTRSGYLNAILTIPTGLFNGLPR